MLLDALRSLRHSRGSSAFILAILTVVIAAATVTFSVVDAVVLRPLPFPQPDRLLALEHQQGDRTLGSVRNFSAAQYLALQEHLSESATLAAVAPGSFTLEKGEGSTEKVTSARVTATLWEVLAIQPVVGHTFNASDEVPGAEPVAVIGYALWTRRFGQDPSTIGQTIDVGGGTLRIVGVMPRDFTYPLWDDRVTEIWTPYVIPPAERSGQQPSRYLHLVARPHGNLTATTLQPLLDGVRARLAASDAGQYAGAGRFAALPLRDWTVGPVRGWMLLVLIAVGLVLLVASANVANLLLSRALGRARELSIRSALGATRARLVASLLLESAILSAFAVAMALVLAWWGVEIVRNALPPGIARAQQIGLNLRVFAAAVVATAFTAAIAGVLPGWHAVRHDLVSVMKNNAGSVAGSRGIARSAVLVTEIALTVVLLVATTMFVSSFIRLVRADLGFDRSRLLLAGPVGSVQGSATLFVERLKTVPGVVEAGGDAAGSPPLVRAGFEGGASGTTISIPGSPANSGVSVLFDRVTPGYFAAAAIPLRRGRVFSAAEMLPSMNRSDLAKTSVAVLDESVARRLFGDADPIGREVVYGPFHVTVIGVVAHVKMGGPEAEGPPQAYFPGATAASSYRYLIRTSGDPLAVAPRLHAAITALRAASDPPLLVRPVEDAFRNITARRRFSAQAMGLFALLALLIGASGVYAVMSSLVAQRTREIGVRMALGATPRRMVGDVLRQIARQLTLGLAIGLPAAWLIVRGFEGVFFGVRASDPGIYAVVAAGLIIIGLAAASVPARRASLVDPLIALRSD